MSLYQRVAKVLRFGKNRYFVGTDLRGNSFYERPSLIHDASDWKNAKRTVEFVEVKPLSDYRFHDLPVQWNAWLRRTRRTPPTIEELENDFMRQQRLATNVERLAIEYKQEKLRMVEAPVTPSLNLAKPAVADALPKGLPSEDEVARSPSLEDKATVESVSLPGEKPLEAPQTEGEREKALLRQKFARENTGARNPDSSFQPEAWSPPPIKRR